MNQPATLTMPTTNPLKSSLSCFACRVVFSDIELHKQHYKSDWHRYNLKCRVSQLPPLSAEEFQQKVLLHRNMENAAQSNPHVYCDICKKSFGNQNAFNNHLNSKKHRDSIKNNIETSERPPVKQTPQPSSPSAVDIEDSSAINKVRVTQDDDTCSNEDSEIEELNSDEWDEDSNNPIDNNDCIFCLHHSRGFLKNLEHMTTAHSFFIPDIEYCTDVQGLLRYLGEKISEGFMCLWCNEKGRTFHTAEAARSHMMDKGHCKMLHEGLALAEYADFYDYSSSYPDAGDEVDKDEEVDVAEVSSSDYQMVLPSGITIGHRSLMRYYRQNLNPNSAIVVKKDERKLHKVLATYRSLGWTATQQEAAAKKARDLHAMKRLQSRLGLKLGLRANKFQKHFRQQTNY